MYRIYFSLVKIAILVLFFLQGTAIELLGWKYFGSGAGYTAIHPATYLFALCFSFYAIETLANKRYIVDPNFRLSIALFGASALFLVIRAVLNARNGSAVGELSLALVTYLTPLLVFICLHTARDRDAEVIHIFIRLFFLINSLMSIFEAFAGYRLLPGFVDTDNGLQGRAAGLTGHPLNGAVLSGLMLIALIFSPTRRLPKFTRIPEMALLAMAMLAFGGRAAAIFVVAVILVGGLLSKGASGQNRIIERASAILVLIAGAAIAVAPDVFLENSSSRMLSFNDKSTEARLIIGYILGGLSQEQILWGTPIDVLQQMLIKYNTPFGLESSWAQLTAIFGIIPTIPIAASLIIFLLTISRRFGGGSLFIIIYFFLVTATSLSIGSKSLLISELIAIILTLRRLPGPQLGEAALG